MTDRIIYRATCPVRGVLLDLMDDGTVRYPEGVEPAEALAVAGRHLDGLEARGPADHVICAMQYLGEPGSPSYVFSTGEPA